MQRHVILFGQWHKSPYVGSANCGVPPAPILVTFFSAGSPSGNGARARRPKKCFFETRRWGWASRTYPGSSQKVTRLIAASWWFDRPIICFVAMRCRGGFRRLGSLARRLRRHGHILLRVVCRFCEVSLWLNGKSPPHRGGGPSFRPRTFVSSGLVRGSRRGTCFWDGPLIWGRRTQMCFSFMTRTVTLQLS